MGSQVMEVAVWLWSLAIVSVFLGLVFNVLRGLFDGYMDKWEEKYLVNEKAEYEDENILGVGDPLLGEEEIDDEDNPFDDPDVLDFLERADEQGPWDEQYDKSYTIGGLTADKDQGFKKFINKIEGSNSDNNNINDEETK